MPAHPGAPPARGWRPAADFRVIKTVTDLERIGDQVGHVARAVLDRTWAPNRHTRAAAPARDWCARIAPVPWIRLQSWTRRWRWRSRRPTASQSRIPGSMRQLLTYIMEDPRITSSRCNSRGRRVRWNASGITPEHRRYVIYMVHGEDVRHISDDERRQRLAPQTPSA